ncbi:MAG: CHAD domain-containing protein, partial [Parvibaculaceae bacterium]|nr:CHAD domain-containing protein [Parvibaculaceae bacterium]
MNEETASTVPQEIELKLELTAQALKEFRASPYFKKLGLDQPIKHTLRSTYFDTPNRPLKAHNIALRVRDNGQGQLIQTLKTRGVPGDIASVREEHETILGPQDPLPNLSALPENWRMLVESLTDNAPVQPIFETKVSRLTSLITTATGDTVEVALDQGWVTAGPLKHQLREIEFELVTGKPEALYELALGLVQTVPARLGVISKSQRGYALPRPHEHAAQRAASITLAPAMLVEEALAEIIRQSLRQIMANEPAIVEANQPEGVHQMRVALRRLRAGLQGFANWVDDPVLLDFSVQAKNFATSLGRARDMDVFETDIIVPILNDFPDHTGVIKILHRSKRRRVSAWKECLACVASKEFTSFLLHLNLYVEQKAWRKNAVQKARLGMPVQKVASTILKRRRAKLQALANNLKTLTIDERHEMRKHIKKLRYMSAFFASVFPNHED